MKHKKKHTKNKNNKKNFFANNSGPFVSIQYNMHSFNLPCSS